MFQFGGQIIYLVDEKSNCSGQYFIISILSAFNSFVNFMRANCNETHRTQSRENKVKL